MIPGNNIGTEGAKALAELRNLTSLDIDCFFNGMTDEGAMALLKLTKLKALRIACIRFSVTVGSQCSNDFLLVSGV